MIMTHGDDRGLRIPPKMAPIEAVFVPIVRSNDDARDRGAARKPPKRSDRGRFRVRVDDRDQQPGWKYAEWDMRGVPVRIEIGPRDVDAETAVARAARPRQGRPRSKASGRARCDRAAKLPRSARRHPALALRPGEGVSRVAHVRVNDRDEFFEKCRSRAGMIDIPWCGRAECEAHVKAETSATTRNTRPLEGAARRRASRAASRQRCEPTLRNRTKIAVAPHCSLALRSERRSRARPGVAARRSRRGSARGGQSQGHRDDDRRSDLCDRRGRRRSSKSRPTSWAATSSSAFALWGVKFHRRDDARASSSQKSSPLVEKAFAAAPAIEEVDVWTSVPIAVGKGRRSSAATWPNRPRARSFTASPYAAARPPPCSPRAPPDDHGVFWDEEWARTCFQRVAQQCIGRRRCPSGLRVLTETMPAVRSAIDRHLGRRRFRRSNRASSAASRTWSSTCSSKERSAAARAQIAETMDGVGGNLNAFTDKETTCYYAKVIDRHVPLAIDVLADMFLHSTFDPQELAKEQKVVLEEIKMYEDSPDELIHDLFLQTMWSGSNLGEPTIGFADTVVRYHARRSARAHARRTTRRTRSSLRPRATSITTASSNWSPSSSRAFDGTCDAAGAGRARNDARHARAS